MKKLVLVILFLGAVGGGYFVISRLHLNIDIFNGETAPVKRGDLVVPITASGNIKATNVTSIKGKASGEVIKLPVELGDFVHKGQLLVELLDVDEKRSFEQAEAAWEQAKIALEVAKITLKQRQTTAIDKAQANLQQAQAQLDQVLSRYKFLYPQRPEQPNSTVPQVEWDALLATKAGSEASVLAANAELTDAKTIGIKLAEQDVEKATQVVKSTEAAMHDAEERLRETKIISPVDGMVLDKKVQIGEVVQSGKTMFTGGTILVEVADVSEIYAIVNVDEADIGQVRDLAPPEASATSSRPSTQPAAALTTLPAGLIEEGKIVTVTVETFPDEKFEGVITRISPQSEVLQAVATFKVWIKITSANGEKLKKLLNTQAEAHFTVKSVKNALLVNYDAVQKNPKGEDYGVYVPYLEPGSLKPQPKFIPCKFGPDNGIDIEVKSGLKDGDKVYTKLPQKTKQEQEAEEKKNG